MNPDHFPYILWNVTYKYVILYFMDTYVHGTRLYFVRFNKFLKRIDVHCIKLLEKYGPCNELLVSAPGYIRPADSDINCAFCIEFSNFVVLFLNANSVYWDIQARRKHFSFGRARA